MGAPVMDPMQAGPGRLFLVGCPRSGTTLLQAMLAAHPLVDSLPETHFFQHLLGCEDHRRLPQDDGPARRLQHARRRWMASAGWAGQRRARRAWAQLAEPAPRDARVSAQIAQFVATLDRRCLEAGKQVWLEKTPDHLFYIAHIQRQVRGARFIHLLRDGEEVVASLYDAACRYADWAPYRDLERAAARWNLAAAESLAWLGRPGHLLVRYEALLADPAAVLRRIAEFAGFDYSERMLVGAGDAAATVVRADEPWKQAAAGALQDRRKFQQVFDPARQQAVRSRLRGLAWQGLAGREDVIANV